MKKVLSFLLACAMTIALGATASYAADDEIEALKQQIADMQKKLEQLEQKQEAAPAAKSGLPGDLTVHGFARLRLIDSEAENPLGTSSSFEATEVAIQPSYKAGENITTEGHFWFWNNHNGRGGNFANANVFLNDVYIEALKITFDKAGYGDGAKLIIGKDRLWSYGITPTGKNRLTSNYSLYNAAINQARVTGIQSLNKLDNSKIDVNLSLTNGMGIGVRPVAEGNYVHGLGTDQAGAAESYYIIATRDGDLDTNNSRAASLRVGGDVAPWLNMGLSYYYGGKVLTTGQARTYDIYAHRTATQAPNDINGNSTASRDHDMWGFDFTYNYKSFIWDGELSLVELGTLDYDAWQMRMSYDFDGSNLLTIGYGQIDYDRDYTYSSVATTGGSTSSMIWDKQQFVVSFKHKITPRCWIVVEHEFNEEDTPGLTGVDYSAQTDNDMSFIEIMTVF